ncbi:DUF397 domain-containing protein [Streptomyces atroolivaceus]|uniref:DUF397 domain-containing protein n=1 Tax=Streptomyces atroolivaceus TaxID=66869 RepID=UPI002025AE09|nr:DUF397 domain-containing protein [Streptomyces atroolivaceus]
MGTAPDPRKAVWRKSSYSNGEGGSCVEIADGLPGLVPVRDSKAPDGPALTFRAAHWTRFVEALRGGSL